MAKVYNTPEYRKDKRVVAFCGKTTKGKILKAAREKKISISKEITATLEEKYGR